MSEAREQSKKPDSGLAMLVGVGIGCLGCFLFGLAEVLWSSETGNTFELVLGLLGMLFGGTGAAFVGKRVITKQPKERTR